MKRTTSSIVTSIAIFLIFLFIRTLLTQSSSSKAAAPKETEAKPLPDDVQPTEAAPVAPVAMPAIQHPHSGPRHLGLRTASTVGLAVAMVAGLLTTTAGIAFAAQSVDSPGKVQSDTTQLNWTGQGTSNGVLDQSLCGDQADPGHSGFENGADANNYLLWIFNDANGSVSGAVTITINGVDYTDANDGHQIVTPGIDPSTITDAHANFAVAVTGNGKWVLTISHGCAGTVQDQPFAPTGHVGGPCADPSYYGVFDNTATDSSYAPVKFRLRWYNGHGLNVIVKHVPGGFQFTTYVHWATVGTYVTVSYLDPTSGTWILLDKVQVEHQRFPVCTYQPGWSPSVPVA